MTYDPGLRVAANEYALQEASLRAPRQKLMNFIFQGTGGARSPYVFDTTDVVRAKPNARSPQCATALCAVGMSPNGLHKQPDYIPAQGNFYVPSGRFAINLYDGSSYWQDM